MKPRPKAKERRRKRRIRRAKRLKRECTIAAVERILSRPQIELIEPDPWMREETLKAVKEIQDMEDKLFLEMVAQVSIR